MDGSRVGKKVGVNVGSDDGGRDGSNVGRLVGKRLGGNDGTGDGFKVGKGEGFRVNATTAISADVGHVVMMLDPMLLSTVA